MPTPRDDALRAEIREARQNARLRYLAWLTALVVISLLVACLVSTIIAADNAGKAADGATAQAKTNERLIRELQLGAQKRGEILSEVRTLNKEQLLRMQDLLDTIYGPGVVTLGVAAPVPSPAVLGPRTKASTAAPDPSPDPSPSPSPSPSSRPPFLPVPTPTPAPSPTSLLCRLLPVTC